MEGGRQPSTPSLLLIAFAAFHPTLPLSLTDWQHSLSPYDHLHLYKSRHYISCVRAVPWNYFCMSFIFFFGWKKLMPLSFLSSPPHHLHRSFSHGPSSEEVGTCSRRLKREW